MPRRWIRILLIVLAIAVVLWIVGYFLFSLGDDAPGNGRGETITGLTTP